MIASLWYVMVSGMSLVTMYHYFRPTHIKGLWSRMEQTVMHCTSINVDPCPGMETPHWGSMLEVRFSITILTVEAPGQVQWPV